MKMEVVIRQAMVDVIDDVEMLDELVTYPFHYQCVIAAATVV